VSRLALKLLCVSLSLAASASTFAQTADRMYRPPTAARPGELVFYSEPNFQGRAYYVTGPRTNLTLPFQARSFQVAPGEAWQVCARTRYRNPCTIVSRSNDDRGLLALVDIRSARPQGGGGDDGEFSGSGYPGPSLQGMASQFFRAPEDRGSRVLACRSGSATAACAADTADRFCRARGYAGGAAYERIETVNRRNYLADVLCSRSIT
jgi:hypothetical protein